MSLYMQFTWLLIFMFSVFMFDLKTVTICVKICDDICISQKQSFFHLALQFAFALLKIDSRLHLLANTNEKTGLHLVFVVALMIIFSLLNLKWPNMFFFFQEKIQNNLTELEFYFLTRSKNQNFNNPEPAMVQHTVIYIYKKRKSSSTSKLL